MRIGASTMLRMRRSAGRFAAGGGNRHARLRDAYTPQGWRTAGVAITSIQKQNKPSASTAARLAPAGILRHAGTPQAPAPGILPCSLFPLPLQAGDPRGARPASCGS